MPRSRKQFLGKGISYTEAEKKAILQAYRGYFGKKTWKRSIFSLYHDFLQMQPQEELQKSLPTDTFDIYDLAALAYLYQRIPETTVISEAHHIVIDEAQDFGMMAYLCLNSCIRGCTITIMGDDITEYPLWQRSYRLGGAAPASFAGSGRSFRYFEEKLSKHR